MYLKEEAKQVLENIVGKSITDLLALDLSEEYSYVEEKTKTPLKFSKEIDSRMMGRGNPLINRRRLSTMFDINKKISELK